MMTRRYLLSTTPSRSSIGGFVMPSGAGLPATFCLPELSCASPENQGYQLIAHVLDGRVDQGDVELRFGGQLGARLLQPPGDEPGRLGAAPVEPADKLIPRRRRQEDQQRARNRGTYLPRARHVDLEQHRNARGQLLLHRRARRAMPVADEAGPLQQLPGLDQPVEPLVVD